MVQSSAASTIDIFPLLSAFTFLPLIGPVSLPMYRLATNIAWPIVEILKAPPLFKASFHS